MANSDNKVKPELLPCPFCGAPPRCKAMTKSDVHYGEYWPTVVQCIPCGIIFRGDKAISSWNNRADSPKEKL